MSPNKPTGSSVDFPELENEIQNINFNQFTHQFNATSDDDLDQIVDNGYVLLSQDLNAETYELDAESESDYDEDDNSGDERRESNSNYCRWNVNIEWADNDDNVGGREQQNDDDNVSNENRIVQETSDESKDNNAQSDDNQRLKTYVNSQLNTEEKLFEREYDKRQSNEIVNPINLDEANIDTIKECMKKISLPLDSMPSWANGMTDLSISERLTNFIYKRATSK